jgi:nucleoside 2-deoxyribosyltransferase
VAADEPHCIPPYRDEDNYDKEPAPMKVYLAGPDVFLPDAVEVGQRKAAICARHGLTGFYPLDNAVDLAAHDASRAIYAANEAMMIASDAIVANLTPFRGASADAGTVFELGFMAGRGKLCLGYSNDIWNYTERVRRREAVKAVADGRLIDTEGLWVEDFGLADNLMIVHGLDVHGCPLIAPRLPPLDPWHDLTAFEACVHLVAERLAPPPKPRPRPAMRAARRR